MAKQPFGGDMVLRFDDSGTLIESVEFYYTLQDDVNTELTARKALDPSKHPTGQTIAVQNIITAWFNAMKTEESIIQ